MIATTPRACDCHHMEPADDTPVAHRRRRRAAAERAAVTHDRAAAVHRATAAFFDEHGDPDKADRHRAAAATDAAQAVQERDEADRQ